MKTKLQEHDEREFEDNISKIRNKNEGDKHFFVEDDIIARKDMEDKKHEFK